MLIGCFYAVSTPLLLQYIVIEEEGSVVDHFVCITVTAAHLTCEQIRWNQIEPIFVK